MWWGRMARSVVKLLFFCMVVVGAAFILSAVLYLFLQGVGLIEK
jgi:hypothetical protein